MNTAKSTDDACVEEMAVSCDDNFYSINSHILTCLFAKVLIVGTSVAKRSDVYEASETLFQYMGNASVLF